MKESVQKIFISYSHKDKRWLDFLHTHLAPFIENGSINPWDDTKISIGSNWVANIESALTEAQLVVFLVSPNFLASKFIKDHERDPIFQKAMKTGLITMFPVLITDCAFEQTYLKDIQFFVPEGGLKPLDSLPVSKRNTAIKRICIEIKQLLN